MKNKIFKALALITIAVLVIGGVYLIWDVNRIGQKVDSYKNVNVYHNGLLYAKSYGKNYSEDGYYYGQRWQCVEYVKRFYYEAKQHKIPDGYGNAKDFFDEDIIQGELNPRRALVQYRNEDKISPEPDDLMVFTDTKFGHVAIITEVGSNYVEVIQQNIYRKTRERYELTIKDNKYFVGSKRKPAGWLRKK